MHLHEPFDKLNYCNKDYTHTPLCRLYQNCFLDISEMYTNSKGFDYTGSYLISIAVCLPVGDTVLLGDILALREQLLVRDLFLVLDALLLNELLGGQHSLTELLLLQALLAFFVWHNLKHQVHEKLLYINLYLSAKYEAKVNCQVSQLWQLVS